MACALSPADATTDSVTEQAFVAFLDGIADMPQAQAVPIFMSRRRIGPTSDCMSRLPEQ